MNLSAWLEAYGAAWEGKDPEAAQALFTENATYRKTPYDEPFRGRSGIRAYWSEVTADQRDIDFNFDVLSAAGTTGIAHWTSRFSLISSGKPVELNGIFVLEFEGELCASLREWWHAR